MAYTLLEIKGIYRGLSLGQVKVLQITRCFYVIQSVITVFESQLSVGLEKDGHIKASSKRVDAYVIEHNLLTTVILLNAQYCLVSRHSDEIK